MNNKKIDYSKIDKGRVDVEKLKKSVKEKEKISRNGKSVLK
jgi:hypothetical protein